MSGIGNLLREAASGPEPCAGALDSLGFLWLEAGDEWGSIPAASQPMEPGIMKVP
jgi:hypothetical protein